MSLFFRLFRLPEFIAYHQDQVRDLIYVKDFFDRGQIILLGPKASVGDFFLPPFWYYLMEVMYWFSSSPVAPAALTAVLSAATSLVIYKFSRKFFNSNVAFAAALIYSVSHLSIEYSRFAWNPNPIPFFTILTLYFLCIYIYEGRAIGFWGGAIAASLAFQLHYQGLIVAIFFPLAILYYRKMPVKRFFQYILINLAMILPFIIYEIGNNFANTRGILDFALRAQGNPGLRYFGIPFFIKFMLFGFSSFLGKVLFFKNDILGYLALIVLGVSLLFPMRDKKARLLQLFFMFCFVMFFVYKNSLIDFYLLFLIPVVVIYFAVLAEKFLPRGFFYFTITVIALFSIILSPSFGKTDDTYVAIKAATRYITAHDNYCIIYKIHPTNFIESKYRYLVSLAENQPKDVNCEKILYDYQCSNKVKTVFHLCGGGECQLPKRILNMMKTVDQRDYRTGVNIYQMDY